MKRGDIHWADLDPAFRSEPGKVRPVVVIQTDLLNQAGHRSTIILPITTNVRSQPYPYRVDIPKGTAGMGRPSDVLVDQIQAIDNARLQNRLGDLPSGILSEVESKLLRVLDLL
jgi:mRNA interferase MazF